MGFYTYIIVHFTIAWIVWVRLVIRCAKRNDHER